MTPKHILAAAALVTNEDDHVLMIYSPRRGWETPGGQVEQGEDLLAGLLREIREESGVVAAIGPLVGLYSNLNPVQPIIIAGFLARYVSGTLTPSPESSQVVWVPRPEVLARISDPAIYERVQDMLNFARTLVYRAYTKNPYQVFVERVLEEGYGA